MAENLDEATLLRAALRAAAAKQARDRAIIAALRRELDDHQREEQQRVRTILSIVRSIARRTVEEEETIETYRARLDSRLASFANLQGQIADDPQRGIDLQLLIGGELLAFGIELGDQAHADGPRVRLKARPASILGLAIHELVRMAVEGGASAGLDGHIDVAWQSTTDAAGAAHFEIVWVETGRRPFAGPKPDATFGREVIEQAVAHDVNGKVQLDITDDGLRCRFLLPVDGVCRNDVRPGVVAGIS